MAGVERIDTAVFDSTAAAQRFREDLQELGKAGQTTDITVLTGAALREQVPLASRAVRVGLSVNGQRFIDPARFVAALGRAVLNRGATLRTLEVAEIVNAANGIAVRGRRRAPLMTEAAVIATGAQFPQLAGPRLGEPVRAGPPDVHRAWQTRIRQIHDLSVRADVGEDPPDDGIAEPGMVLTVRYHDTGDTGDTGDTETFLLGARGAEHGDVEVYSPRSPLGAAVTGALPGEQRSFTLPGGATLTVTLVSAVPYGVHMAGAT
ncbi:hypothetical protein B4U45_25825 [Mycobacterium persicum]|uniref:Transcription elongation factor GreA n=2 Tax=Mycobacterium persicum TaxID=1487726 RepID=A0A8E2IX19_9MYCO|nr:hypothetical protein B1T44_26305 [Mycobacterium persicum]ORC09509.1 hypothetical protein B4U45_25825 [Mycobacterium persicum]VAZ74711.1 Transcription elongation factor GreA [Mycobacterium persicum]VAZ92455.1 Transcription elongation factor GreA [Mycobacterium persicum]